MKPLYPAKPASTFFPNPLNTHYSGRSLSCKSRYFRIERHSSCNRRYSIESTGTYTSTRRSL